MNNDAKVILKDEFDFFMTNREDLVKKYEGKYLAIKNNQVLGVYDSFDTAIIKTQKTDPLGTFLIQKCEANDECYMQTFHSRVHFIN